MKEPGASAICRSALQAKHFREQQRLGLASQEEFVLDTSGLYKSKANKAGVAQWGEDDNAASDDDFDGPAQAGLPPCMLYRVSPAELLVFNGLAIMGMRREVTNPGLWLNCSATRACVF